MTSVGIIGGIAPESTVDYYRRIVAGWQAARPGTSPHIIITSIDVNRVLELTATDRAALVEYLAAELDRLAAAGADFAVLAANTPHIVFDDLRERSPIPLISIVEATADAARERGLRRPALLGTRFTVEAPFYPAVFAERGMTVVVPAPDDRAMVHERYTRELLRVIFRDETRDEITALVARLRDEEGADSVILGGTELSLLLKDPTVAGVPALDTIAIHAAAIVGRLLEGEGTVG